MKTVFYAILIALTLAALPALARQSELTGGSDPSVEPAVLVASNTVYGPGERAQVHDGWG